MKATFLCFLILIQVMTGYGQSNAETNHAPTSIKVVTFNVRYGKAPDGPNNWENRQELVVNHLKEINADFIGLQEALRFQIDTIARGLPDFDWIGVGRGDSADGGEYSPIFYRSKSFRPDPDENGTFWLSDTPETPNSITWGNTCTRICTWARFIHKKTGRGIYIYNTHLDHRSQPSREKAIILIISRIANRLCQQEPYLLMGDFNANEDNSIFNIIRESAPATPLIDTFRKIHPEATEVLTFNGFNPVLTNLIGSKIDYVFSSNQLVIKDSSILHQKIDNRYISDHYAVTTELDIIAPTSPIGPPYFHSHNDYHRVHPLYDALAYGANSIEADIFLTDKDLYVAHSQQEIHEDRTLRSLYLKPFSEIAVANHGKIYPDSTQPLRFHIDLKTDGDTINVLHRQLAQYPDLFEHYTPEGIIIPGPIRVLVWDRYRESLDSQPLRFVNFIAGMDSIDSELGKTELDGHHANWNSLFKWTGQNTIPAEEKEKLANLVKAIHAQGRTVRFWSIPQNQQVYQELARAGVDFINTDDPAYTYDFIVKTWSKSQKP